MIALIEKSVAFEPRIPTSFGTGKDDPLHLAANPFGEVPTFIRDGLAIFESSVIFDYIDNKWPTPPLMPSDPARRARSLMIQTVMSKTYDPIKWGQTEFIRLGRITGAKAEAVRAYSTQQANRINAWLTS